MRSGAWKWLQAVLVVVAILAVGRAIWVNWDDVRKSPVQLAFRPGWIALSLGATWAMYAALVEGWRRLVVGWGETLPWFAAARIWILASIAAFVPGRVWGLAGMAILSERAGARSSVTVGAAIVMQVLAIGTGIGVAAIAVGPELRALRPEAGTAMTIVGVLAILSVAILHQGGALRLLWRVAGRTDAPPQPPGWGALVEAAVVNTVSWLGYGVALWALARGILTGVDLPLRVAIGAFAVSYIAGYLVVFTPGGLGVREVFMVGVLTPSLGPQSAIALSVASRLAIIVNQAVAAAPFLRSRESVRDRS
ncbi:MAG: lysylphosphatidylglycerol synthase domain-containing protein [Gemmatimonadales bacterium]